MNGLEGKREPVTRSAPVVRLFTARRTLLAYNGLPGTNSTAGER